MADSLTVADFELLGGGVPSVNPGCLGATFYLADPFDFGAPQPTPELVANMVLDGERQSDWRASNRTIVLPVTIRAPSRLILDAARELIMTAIEADFWPMVYTRDDPATTDLPLVFDCQHANATVVNYSLLRHRQLVSDIVLTFQAAPYGRSDVVTEVDFPAAVSGRPTPPAPVLIDDFSTVSGTQFAQSLIGPGPFSAHWDPSISPANNPSGVGLAPSYTKTGLALDLCQGTDTIIQSTGTTTTYTATTAAAGLSRVGDKFQLRNTGGTLKEATIFTITSMSVPVAGIVTVKYSPASAVASVSTDHARQTGPSKVPALTVYAGFGSTKFFANWAKAGGSVQFQFTLTDGTSTVAFSVNRKSLKGSNNSGTPIWYTINVPVPQTTAVNMSAITGYTIKVVTLGGTTLPYTDLYLDSLNAAPVAQAALPLQRGQVHVLSGIKGTARAAASWWFQQQGSAVLTTKKFATPGSFLWQAPPGVTSYSGFAIGAGGDSPNFLANGGGGGGGGGSALDAAVAVTPGNWYLIKVGKRGSNQGNGQDSTFAGDSVTRTAGGGKGTSSSTAGLGGTAGVGGFAGGPGGAGVAGNNGGGGGGGSAGSGSVGGTGGAASGTTGGTPGTAGTGTHPGGIGGRGGSFNVGNGATPTTGYGGGHGGSPPGFGRRDYGGFSDGYVEISYLQPPAAKTLIAHRPGPKAPDTLCPFVSIPVTDIPDGTTEYPVQSMITGQNARFDGTYTVYAINAAWNNPSASRSVFVTVKQYDQPGATPNVSSTATKAFVPNTDPDVSKNGIVNLGEITLPDKRIPPENLGAIFTLTITDSNTSDDWYDILLLDTRGSTVVINSTTAYVNYFIDEPLDNDLGLIMGSALDRTDAVSVTSQALAISGPPLGVNPEGNQVLLVYAVDGNGAPGVYMSHYPRWRTSRMA